MKCEDCKKVYSTKDHWQFKDPITSQEAKKLYGKYCWKCLIFYHTELLKTSIIEEEGIKESQQTL